MRPTLVEYHVLSAPASPAITYDADRMLAVATAAAFARLGGGTVNLAPFSSVDELVGSATFRTVFHRRQAWRHLCVEVLHIAALPLR